MRNRTYEKAVLAAAAPAVLDVIDTHADGFDIESFSLQVISNSAAGVALKAQVSNNGVNWTDTHIAGVGTSTVGVTINSGGIYGGSLRSCRWLRINLTAITGGSIDVHIFAKKGGMGSADIIRTSAVT